MSVGGKWHELEPWLSANSIRPMAEIEVIESFFFADEATFLELARPTSDQRSTIGTQSTKTAFDSADDDLAAFTRNHVLHQALVTLIDSQMIDKRHAWRKFWSTLSGSKSDFRDPQTTEEIKGESSHHGFSS